MSESAAAQAAAYAAYMASVATFLREVYAEVAIAIIVILARLVVRFRTVGHRNLAWDDLGMVFVMAWLIVDAVGFHRILDIGAVNAHMSDEVRAVLTPGQVDTIVLGTKWYYAGQFMYIITTWSIKSCMTFLLGRIVYGLPQHKWVKITHFVIVITFIGIAMSYFLICLPFSDRFQVSPAPRAQCLADSAYTQVTGTPANIIIDILLLGIPIPLLWQSTMPLGKKIGLCVLLCGGVFTMIACLLRTILSVGTQDTSGAFPAVWTIREYFVGTIVTNLPLLVPMTNRSFWSKKSYRANTYTYQPEENSTSNSRTNRSNVGKGVFSQSEVELRAQSSQSERRGQATQMNDIKIHHQQEFTVSSKSVEREASRRNSVEAHA